MLLKKRKFFISIGFALLIVILISKTLIDYNKVSAGHSLDTFQSPRGLTWDYGSAFIADVAIIMALLYILVKKFILKRSKSTPDINTDK